METFFKYFLKFKYSFSIIVFLICNFPLISKLWYHTPKGTVTYDIFYLHFSNNYIIGIIIPIIFSFFQFYYYRKYKIDIIELTSFAAKMQDEDESLAFKYALQIKKDRKDKEFKKIVAKVNNMELKYRDVELDYFLEKGLIIRTAQERLTGNSIYVLTPIGKKVIHYLN